MTERDLSQALARIRKLIAAFGLGGTAAAFAFLGWAAAGGFALGAVISWLNFHWLHQSVNALAGKPIRKRFAVAAGLRYLLLGGAAYVILRFSKINRAATLTGLFVTVAAAIVEMIFELRNARN
jgi:ATP synthase I chain